MSNFFGFSRRLAVIFSIVLLIAIVHILRVGSHLQGKLFILYYSYFSDIVLPFACYFLLCAAEVRMPIFKRWEAKFAIAFLLPALAETCQYFGITVLGSTFDLLDYLMYGMGAILAVIIDRQLFSRIFDFWTMGKQEK